MTDDATTTQGGIRSLLDIMRQLRDPDSGCPWDLEQNFHTIVPYTIEETYELADAIAAEDFSQIRDELGDVLFQVVFYAQMASEQARPITSLLRSRPSTLGVAALLPATAARSSLLTI